MGGYFRRQADWALQNNLAACEIMQIDKQLAAAHIRVDIAQHELDAHERQMENAQAILDYMTNQKFTNQDLYGWMISETASSYFSCYQMAFTIAKKAERTFRFERGLTDSNFIQFGYWDSLRKGLLAGDQLHLALLQMEAAYTDQNVREYEISRDISVLLNAPLALIALKETGSCEIAIPESFFDADYPGHYMRRIKNVTLSVPCVVGPYTSLNCKLTLLTNKTRISSALGDQYAENAENGDDRFVNNFAAVQSIATSHGVNDSGLFEVNFRDERYLPFEGGGAISRWRLEMPKDNNAFDFETISDVILHLRYTARGGGQPLTQAARQALAGGPQDDLLRLFDLRHEFPATWYGFLNPSAASATSLSMTLDLAARPLSLSMARESDIDQPSRVVSQLQGCSRRPNLFSRRHAPGRLCCRETGRNQRHSSGRYRRDGSLEERQGFAERLAARIGRRERSNRRRGRVDDRRARRSARCTARIFAVRRRW